jgi:hypothetical protein
MGGPRPRDDQTLDGEFTVSIAFSEPPKCPSAVPWFTGSPVRCPCRACGGWFHPSGRTARFCLGHCGERSRCHRKLQERHIDGPLSLPLNTCHLPLSGALTAWVIPPHSSLFLVLDWHDTAISRHCSRHSRSNWRSSFASCFASAEYRPCFQFARIERASRSPFVVLCWCHRASGSDRCAGLARCRVCPFASWRRIVARCSDRPQDCRSSAIHAALHGVH